MDDFSDFSDLDNETICLINEGRYTENEMEKIFALKALESNSGILDNVHTFSKLMQVMNNLKPSVETFEPISILVIAKGIKELRLQEHDFNNEIKFYIAHIAFEEGWIKLPEILNWAQEELDELSFEFELDEDITKMQELKHKAVERYLQ